MVATWLKSHIRRRTFNRLLCSPQCCHLGMCFTRAFMPTLGDDPVAFGDNTANARVRVRRLEPLLGKGERTSHGESIEFAEHHVTTRDAKRLLTT